MSRPAFIQTPGGATSGPGTSLNLLSFISPLTLNSLALVVFRLGGTADLVTSVNDGSGHELSQIYNVVTGSNRLYVYGSRKTTLVSLSQSVGVTLSSSGTIRGFPLEYGLVTTGTLVDVDQSGTLSSATTQTAPAISTGLTDETILAIISLDTAGDISTAGSGFTERVDHNQRIQLQEADGTATGSFTSAWTLSTASTVAYVVLGLKSSTSVVPTPVAVSRMGLMGVG